MNNPNPTIENKQNIPKNIPLDKLGRAYGTGRRKSSVARAWIKKGSGTIQINKRDLSNYFARPYSKATLIKPLSITKTEKEFDIFCTVKGGGCSGQADAISLAISRALVAFSHDAYHQILRNNKLLTRDSRAVESKRYGRHKARKATQFAKR